MFRINLILFFAAAIGLSLRQNALFLTELTSGAAIVLAALTLHDLSSASAYPKRPAPASTQTKLPEVHSER